jgi:hypothetical protein
MSTRLPSASVCLCARANHQPTHRKRAYALRCALLQPEHLSIAVSTPLWRIVASHLLIPIEGVDGDDGRPPRRLLGLPQSRLLCQEGRLPESMSNISCFDCTGFHSPPFYNNQQQILLPPTSLRASIYSAIKPFFSLSLSLFLPLCSSTSLPYFLMQSCAGNEASVWTRRRPELCEEAHMKGHTATAGRGPGEGAARQRTAAASSTWTTLYIEKQ